ncbi:MAG: hypothetical protein HQK96_10695 [Nitrospirae bacterium]|nr:hypothetical protein [Nitrospirota bacterium]
METLAIVLSILSTGVLIYEAGINIANAIEDLSKQLGNINNSFQTIIKDINDIVNLLISLPDKFRIIIEEEELKKSIISMLSSNRRIIDHFKKLETVQKDDEGKAKNKEDREAIVSICQDITEELKTIQNNVDYYLALKGVSGLFIVAQYIAIYMKCFVHIQLLRQKNCIPYNNPYDSQFYKMSVVKPMNELIETNNEYWKNNKQHFERLPHVSDANVMGYDSAGYFVLTDIPIQPNYNIDDSRIKEFSFPHYYHGGDSYDGSDDQPEDYYAKCTNLFIAKKSNESNDVQLWNLLKDENATQFSWYICNNEYVNRRYGSGGAIMCNRIFEPYRFWESNYDWYKEAEKEKEQVDDALKVYKDLIDKILTPDESWDKFVSI